MAKAQQNQGGTYLMLFGLCSIVLEILVFFTKAEFEALGEIGWLIHGALIFVLMGIGLLSFIISGILKNSGK